MAKKSCDTICGMTFCAVLASACVLWVTLFSQTPTVEITSEPSHHQIFQNDYVRVFKVEIAPHAATLRHRHHYDYF